MFGELDTQFSMSQLLLGVYRFDRYIQFLGDGIGAHPLEITIYDVSHTGRQFIHGFEEYAICLSLYNKVKV